MSEETTEALLATISTGELQAILAKRTNEMAQRDLEDLEPHDSRRRLEKLPQPRRCLLLKRCSRGEANSILQFWYSGPLPPYLSELDPQAASDAEQANEESKVVGETTMLDNGMPSKAGADRTMAIQDALSQLDHQSDGDWTINLQPNLDVMETLLHREGHSSASRAEILDANPSFLRDLAHAADAQARRDREEAKTPAEESPARSTEDIMGKHGKKGKGSRGGKKGK